MSIPLSSSRQRKESRMQVLNRPITDIHGIGPQKARAFLKLGIRTFRDLLYHMPRGYENRGDIQSLLNASLLQESRGMKQKAACVLTVSKAPRVNLIRKGMHILKLTAFDDTGVCEIAFFNQDYLKPVFPVGSTFRFWGYIERQGGMLRMSSPVYEPVEEQKPLPEFYAVYPLCEGVTQKLIRQSIQQVLYQIQGKLEDPFPEELRDQYGLLTLEEALTRVHTPYDWEEIEAGKHRLAFDELFYFSAGLALTRNQRLQTGAPVCENADLSAFLKQLPYALTGAQSRAVEDIRKDMAREVPMNRILVGDVGCGKTVCAAAAIYIAVRNGRQAALMAPTEILARQHHRDLSSLFGALGIRCELLIGSTPKRKKDEIYRLIGSEPDPKVPAVVIGTQALLSEHVAFSRPGIVVVDEQQRFGVNQRARLADKNGHYHLLVMSATPIPRSLALVLYGDLDISRIDEMPPGRQRVDTYVVDGSYHERVNAFIRRIVENGGQVYVVCPAVENKLEEDEDSQADVLLSGERVTDAVAPTLKAAVDYADTLTGELPGIRVRFMHGKMKDSEKEDVMNDFSSGNIDVLVSTTVIEVGVNVPNACLMIVENAERFGLSQLHQLRGRVGRGTKKAYCILVSNAKGENASRRLETMRTQYDGYAIAEEDLKIRGPGDFLPMAGQDNIRQSGELSFQIASATQDQSLLLNVRKCCDQVLNNPGFESEYPQLAQEILRRSIFQKDIIN